MRADEQRKAMAEFFGWIFDPSHGPLSLPWRRLNVPTWEDGKGWSGRFAQVPDYLNDLNVMHEAEKVLTDEQWERYEPALWNIVAPGEIVRPSMPIRFARAFLSATAAQRAEAFLRTLNLWTL